MAGGVNTQKNKYKRKPLETSKPMPSLKGPREVTTTAKTDKKPSAAKPEFQQGGGEVATRRRFSGPSTRAPAKKAEPKSAGMSFNGPKKLSKDYPYNKPSTNTQLKHNATQDASHTRKPVPATAHKEDKQAAWRRAQLTGQGDNWNARKGKVNRDGRH